MYNYCLVFLSFLITIQLRNNLPWDCSFPDPNSRPVRRRRPRACALQLAEPTVASEAAWSRLHHQCQAAAASAASFGRDWRRREGRSREPSYLAEQKVMNWNGFQQQTNRCLFKGQLNQCLNFLRWILTLVGHIIRLSYIIRVSTEKVTRFAENYNTRKVCILVLLGRNLKKGSSPVSRKKDLKMWPSFS